MAGLVDAGDFTNKDVYLAYLPLAHIMVRPPRGSGDIFSPFPSQRLPLFFDLSADLPYDVCEDPQIYLSLYCYFTSKARA